MELEVDGYCLCGNDPDGDGENQKIEILEILDEISYSIYPANNRTSFLFHLEFI